VCGRCVRELERREIMSCEWLAAASLFSRWVHTAISSGGREAGDEVEREGSIICGRAPIKMGGAKTICEDDEDNEVDFDCFSLKMDCLRAAYLAAF